MKVKSLLPVLACASVIAALFMVIPIDARAAAPSFDCDNARAKDEVAICSSSELSMLDGLMDEGFRFLKGSMSASQARQIAHSLLSARQACGADTECIMKTQIEAINTYQRYGAPLKLPDGVSAETPSEASDDGMPVKIGTCTASSVDQIGPRLEGDGAFESGTSVGFANGGSQVSYDSEWAIIRSKLGDPVRICLVSLPKDCPPGDDRGKEYKVTNLRTDESWRLADSQHVCGGA